MATLLSDMLRTQASHPLLDTDPGWRQYVLDHLAYVKASARQITPTKEMLMQCSYNVPRYLRSQHVNPVYTWIFYLINNISSDQDFSVNFAASTIYLPDQKTITDMYTTYKTISQENS